LFLRGRAALGANVQYNRANGDVAYDLFRRALHLDPRLGAAYAGIANLEYLRYGWGEASTLDAVRTNAERAIELDPTLATAYVALMGVADGNGQSELCLKMAKRVERAGLPDVSGLAARAEGLVPAGLPERAVPLLNGIIELAPANI